MMKLALQYICSWLLAISLLSASAFFAIAQPKLTYERPIYSPEAKSYFELVPVHEHERSLSKRKGLEISWDVADQLAQKRVFKGVKGRLAVVDKPEIHNFLLKNFPIDTPAWIGLRYFCKARSLQWTSGASHNANQFRAWAPKWNQAVPGAGCLPNDPSGRGWGERPYMPVAYTSVRDGFRWIAMGGGKEYELYFVEYPTGRP